MGYIAQFTLIPFDRLVGAFSITQVLSKTTWGEKTRKS